MAFKNINFKDIKESLKDYVKSKNEFKDYNFEGSVINTLLDVLAHNTYQSQFYLNMIGNEMFLDTSTLEGSVISHAKKLGYTPKSAKSSRADIQLNIYPDDDANQLIIPKHSKFVSKYEDVNYYFYNLEEYIINEDDLGNFIAEITIFEGTPVTYTFDYSDDVSFYKLTDRNVDTSTMRVYVSNDANSLTKTEYTLADNILDLKSDSKVYYLQVGFDGRYEIYFGDDVLGKKLTTGNRIIVDTIVTRGSIANELQKFQPKDYVVFKKGNSLKYYTNVVITTINPSTSGVDRESVESIKFAAPKKFALQNRAIIEDDYKNWVLSNYNDIESISVWGGEKHTPPLFGKVVMAVKPKDGYYLSTSRKTEIVNGLTRMSGPSIDPIIVDPIMTYILLNTKVIFESSKTTASANDIVNSVSDILTNYEASNLGKFEQGFYLSPITTSIKDIDYIQDNSSEITLEKRLTPIINTNLNYTLSVNASLKIPYSGALGCITSSGFTVEQYANQIVYLDDDGYGNIRIYTINNTGKKYLNNNAGTVDYTNGTIKINSLKVTNIENQNENFIRIYLKPSETYYVPDKNEVLLLSTPTIRVYDKSLKVYIKTVQLIGIGNNEVLYTNYISGSIV